MCVCVFEFVKSVCACVHVNIFVFMSICGRYYLSKGLCTVKI